MSLRLSDAEIDAAGRLKRSDETVQAFLRRLLRETARRRGVSIPPPRGRGRPTT